MIQYPKTQYSSVLYNILLYNMNVYRVVCKLVYVNKKNVYVNKLILFTFKCLQSYVYVNKANLLCLCKQGSPMSTYVKNGRMTTNRSVAIYRL